MSIEIGEKIICSKCNKPCRPFDSYILFGSQGPEGLEPLDEEYICEKCFPKVKKEWIKNFKHGGRDGDYCKSRAESEAAKECGLAWVGSGTGILGTSYFLEQGQYVSKQLFGRISKLPYWGWCMVCGAKRTGGYCSDKKCEKSFGYSERKTKNRKG